jgi:protein ImuA
MPQPVALAVARSRAAVMEELRRLLPGMEARRAPLPFGLAALDSHLPQGGLASDALHEIVPDQGAMPAAFGFLVALLARFYSSCPFSPPPCGEGLGVGVERQRANTDALTPPNAPPPYPPPQGGRVLLILPTYGQREHGRLSGHGLSALGLDPARLLLVETTHWKDTLWAMEQALRSAAPAAVAGVIDRLELKMSQRLHLAATEAGLPLFLLRAAPSLPSPANGGGWGEGSATATRWRVGAVKAARDRFGLITRPRWHLQLERCRNGRPGEWIVEYDHVAHRFSLAATLADPALSRRAGSVPLRQAG